MAVGLVIAGLVSSCGGSASNGSSPWGSSSSDASSSSGGPGGGSSSGAAATGSSSGAPSAGVDGDGAAPGSGGSSGSGSDGAGPGAGAVDAAGSKATSDAGTRRDASGSGAVDAAVTVAGDGGLLPYKGVANSACNDLPTLGASWYYNWTLSPGTCTASEFVPMIWGHTGTEQSASGIAGEVASLKAAGYRTVLGFNEPDNSSQSNIPVDMAIALWPSFDDPSVRIGSPATQANTTGMAWFTSFMQEVNADTSGTLRVDFIAAHWYGWNSGSCDAKAATLEAYLKQLEAIPGNRPIWLTEWGCLNQSNPTAAVVQAFYSGAMAMLAKHPRVERYAWYPWTTNNELVASDDTLTALGTVFAAAPSTR